jgi:serine/threonine protein kinase
MTIPNDFSPLNSWQDAPTTPPTTEPVTLGLPSMIGRYRVEKVLGKGGFGIVYLAHDEQLQRSVAVKVPNREQIAGPEDAEAYLAEARILAGLDHPHIVPVFDVGTWEDCLPFVVSKLIEGSDLKEKIKDSRPSFIKSTALVATIAEALHYAHRKGLVHRDVKPANILIDTAGKPYVADFGLALKEEDFGKGAGFAGTPFYMSPEQARGEGHRVDGRSDIFSLGIVFYELLTGRRPFRCESREELLDQIANVEARPPRQVDDVIPKELERICLKALCKVTWQRYTTARDMAEDLRIFLGGARRCENDGWGSGSPSDPMLVPTEESSWRSSIQVGSGAMEGRTYELLKHRILLGRNADCDISISDPNMARYHAQLVRTIEGYCIEDLGTFNGTYINGRQIRGRVLLQENDHIHVGGTVSIYHIIQLSPSSPSNNDFAH